MQSVFFLCKRCRPKAGDVFTKTRPMPVQECRCSGVQVLVTFGKVKRVTREEERSVKKQDVGPPLGPKKSF